MFSKMFMGSVFKQILDLLFLGFLIGSVVFGHVLCGVAAGLIR